MAPRSKSGTPAPTATPRRTTRSSGPAEALPVVQTRPSYAYGALGKASLSAQVSASHADVDEAFTTSAQPAAEPPTRRSRKTPPMQPLDEEDDVEEPAPLPNGLAPPAENDTRPETGADSTAFRAPKAPSPTAEAIRREVEPPARAMITLGAAARWLTSPVVWMWFLLAFSLFAGFLLSLATYIPLQGEIASRRDAFVSGVHASLGDPKDPPSHDQGQMFSWFMDRFDNVESRLRPLMSQVNLQNDTLAGLSRMIPSNVAVVESNGELSIPPLFWQALTKQVQGDGSSDLWQLFIDSNDAAIREYFSGIIDTQFEGVAAKHHVVTNDRFQQLIAENNEYIEANFNETLRTFQALVIDQAKDTARAITKEILDDSLVPKMARGQIGGLAYTNLLLNIDRRMRETNYFSLGLGAVVEPRFTSKTWRAVSALQETAQWLWRGIGMETSIPRPHLAVHPSTMAMRSWEENGDCWCAPSPEDAEIKLQIGVRTPIKLLPEYFIIEHIPSSGTRDIAAAPRGFEIWVQIDSGEDATRIKESIASTPAHLFPGTCGDPPLSTPPRSDIDENATWICALTDVYDIHALNYVQAFPFPYDIADWGMETWSVVMKVTSNWGADHTCLYRVRLTGNEFFPAEEPEGEVRDTTDDGVKTTWY